MVVLYYTLRFFFKINLLIVRAGIFIISYGEIMENKEKRAENFYESFLTHTESFFRGFTSKNELDFESIQKMVKMANEFVRLDRNHIVYVMQTAKPHKNPHVSHAVRSCRYFAPRKTLRNRLAEPKTRKRGVNYVWSVGTGKSAWFSYPEQKGPWRLFLLPLQPSFQQLRRNGVKSRIQFRAVTFT